MTAPSDRTAPVNRPKRPTWLHRGCDWAGGFLLRHRAALLATVFGFGLVHLRWWRSGFLEFAFLLWNLFLAWLPVVFADLLAQRRRLRAGSSAGQIALAAGWLLFFPNAPYLLTDILHWRPRVGAPPWFDLLLLLHFALLGTALGFTSLRTMRRCVAAAGGLRWTPVFTVMALGLASFGIYLGRFQRFNSWDVLTAPHRLAADIAGCVLQPWAHPHAWGFTLAMTGLLLSLWWTWTAPARELRLGRKSASPPSVRPAA